MTKQAKITLSGAREIPFSALVLSQANVRRVKAGVSIDSLAADIARRGLLQSLIYIRRRSGNQGLHPAHHPQVHQKLGSHLAPIVDIHQVEIA